MSRSIRLFLGVLVLLAVGWLTWQAGASLAHRMDQPIQAYLPLAVKGSPPDWTSTPSATAVSSSTHTPTSTVTAGAPPTHTPTSTVTPTPPSATPTATQPPGGAIIVNHLHTNVLAIPDEWIEAARQFVVHYAHTSHGSQVLSGLEWLAQQDSKYAIDISYSDVVTVSQNTDVLRFYDGNNYGWDNYITPDMYWETEDGLNHTRSVANTGLFDFSLWTWCGQMSYYDDSQIQQYIDAMAQFEVEYPAMRFIFYTGHTDGSEPGSDLWRHNDMVRAYVAAHDKVLFDFADIESYDPAGVFYPAASDACEWCEGWCNAHPTAFACQDLPEPDSECAHTHGLQCTLKGQAFWWLMARLAGWDGTPVGRDR